MLQPDTPDDFVIGTGKAHFVRDFLVEAFNRLNLNYEDYVVVDVKFFRPAEVEFLLGDPSRASNELGWKAETSFTDLVSEMVNAYLEFTG